MKWYLRNRRNQAICQSRTRAEREGVWPGRGFAGAKVKPVIEFVSRNRAIALDYFDMLEVVEEIDRVIAWHLAKLTVTVNALHFSMGLKVRALADAATSHAASRLSRTARGDAHVNIELRQLYAVGVKLRGLHHVALLSARNAHEMLAVG